MTEFTKLFLNEPTVNKQSHKQAHEEESLVFT